MSIFIRLSNIFINEVDAYAFEKIVYESTTHFLNDWGFILTTVYIPSYDIYAHYCNDMKEFVPYKSNEPFDENNKDYKNVRKIKISTTFVGYLCDWYEVREEHEKWSVENKTYFENITK